MVAIKDFGMPNCCVNCDMCLPCAFDEGLCHITQHTIGNIYDKRPSDCPLIEIEQSEDCVSRQAVLDKAELIELEDGQMFYCISPEDVEALPPVTPTRCIAAVRFSKDDLREVCNERIEIECTHGTCKDCTNYVVGALDEEICLRGHELIRKDFYCADFKKRGSENEVN